MSSRAQKKAKLDTATLPLFPNLPSDQPPSQKFGRLKQPVWTEHKANLIARYLFLFVQVTKHGTYIDGFAGPQCPDKLDTWAAKLVLGTEPRWLRHFHLFEVKKNKARLLRKLKASQPKADGRGRRILRDISVYQGDFNKKVRGILKPRKIPYKEAVFCLLDQRMFECAWRTVKRIADYKSRTSQNKIELFYFLGVGWIHRALSGVRGEGPQVKKWFGKSDWKSLRSLSVEKIRDLFLDRFKTELGYKSVAAYPIFERKGSDHIMYYMIHASDHPEAPSLMVRAYNQAVRSLNKATQEKFQWPQD